MGLFTNSVLSSALVGPVQHPPAPVPGPGPGPGPGPTPAKTIYEYPGFTKPPVAAPSLTPTMSAGNAPKPVAAASPKVEPKNAATPGLTLPALLASLPVTSLGSSSGGGAAGSNPNPITAEPTLTWLSNHKGMVIGATAALGVAFYLVLKK